MYASRCGGGHTYHEVAAILRAEELWLRRHIKKLPHSTKCRVVTFFDDDLNRIDAEFHHEPTAALVPAVPAGVSGSHPMAHLMPLPSRRSRRRSR
ncbi:DNA-binding protein [Streptomyces sp. RLB1-33]|nr:DNA-binding protein [Streptomyces sp. RLB1-33]